MKLAQDMHAQNYLVFEGADGSGKSTLARAVTEYMQAHAKLPVYNIAFPTSGTAVGLLIRRVFANKESVSEKAMAYLMQADGVEADEMLRRLVMAQPDLCIIADRHPLVSSWVYQTEVYSLNAVLALRNDPQYLQPEHVFIVDVPEEVAEERIRTRTETRNKMYERPDPAYQTRLRRKYLAYAAMFSRFTHVLDGTLSVDALVAQVEGVFNDSKR